jgi:hypothetical protein
MNLWIILAHTPTWVWLLMAFLIYRGVKALRPSEISAQRALILPIVFLVWGVAGLIFDPGEPAVRIASFVVAILIGFLLGRSAAFLGPPPTLTPGTASLAMPGSPLPLIIILATFAAKYALAVSVGYDRSLQDSISFEALLGAVGGLSAGVLWGLRLTQFARAAGGGSLGSAWRALATRN